MSANMQAAAPTETEKPQWLHVQDELPEEPRDGWPWKLYAGFVVASVVVGLLLTALGIEIRAAWESHRDWVVPVIAMFSCIAGPAVVHLLYRGAFFTFSLGLLLLFLTIGLTVANIIVGAEMPERQTTEDVLSAAAGIAFGLTLAVWIIGSLWEEARYPTEGPEREVGF